MSSTPSPQSSRDRSGIHFTNASGAPARPDPDNIFCEWLFAHSSDSILICDASGNILSVNGSLCDHSGYSATELTSLNLSALLDKDFLEKHPLTFNLLSNKKNCFTEQKLIHKNGTELYVEANAYKIGKEQIVVIARDITKFRNAEAILKRSEANLHTIFDTTETIYVLLDDDLRIVSYNPQAVQFAKKELGKEMEISQHFLDYFPSDYQPMLVNNMRKALSGKPVKYEVNYLQGDQTFNWYYVRLFPISKDNHIYGLMMEVSDITEKKDLEQRLEEERLKKHIEITDAVITAEENERQQIGLELHDNVNQLLTSARLYLSMAKKTKSRKWQSMVNEADTHVNSAINEIRNLSHALISPFIDEFGFMESIEYLLETIRKSSGLIIEKEVNITESNIDKKLGLTIYRILQEQFNNIIKHARASHVSFKLSEEENKLTLSIKDNGIGFQRALRYKGIGLMNIKTRATLFNGNVNILSSPGNGCELVVVFNQFSPAAPNLTL
jgi:PAS domain S-box-containing protein